MKKLFESKVGTSTKAMLLGMVFAGSILAQQIAAQPPNPAPKPPSTASASRYHPDHFSHRADLHYRLVWGVDDLSVKYTESGEVIRFSYRILDAAKAKQLNDKKNVPELIDPQAGVKLVVPSLEKVGQLRQSSTPIDGKSYWMAFSNKGRPVRPGHRVNVVIGDFQAVGLVVE